MPLAPITYQKIIDIFFDYIHTNVSNTSDKYHLLHASFKSGYRTEIEMDNAHGWSGGQNRPFEPWISRVSTKGVTPVDLTAMNTELDNFIKSLTFIDDLNDVCEDTVYLTLVNNLIAFCNIKLSIATSQYTSWQPVIYNNIPRVSTPFFYVQDTTTLPLIVGKDYDEMFINLLENSHNTLRLFNCQYEYSLFTKNGVG